MRSERLKELKEIDQVDFMAAQGHLPVEVIGNGYWFLAPGRNEKTASFKVDRVKNLWFDHGIGKGGTILDFCMAYFGDTFTQAIARLENYLSFHQLPPLSEQLAYKLSLDRQPIAASVPAGEKRKIRVVSSGSLLAVALIRYLEDRRIPLDLAQRYCKEVTYELAGRQYYAIGFPNNRGGYELRSRHFKGSSSPKGATFFDNQAEEVAVFEGFFSFLSFHTLNLTWQQAETNYLVLNSLSFVEASKPIMERHRQVNLYLDQDDPGQKRSKELTTSSLLYKDCSTIYQGHKDLNHWLIHLYNESQSLLHARKVAKEINRQLRPGGRSPGQH